jgi:hypothetical protein
MLLFLASKYLLKCLPTCLLGLTKCWSAFVHVKSYIGRFKNEASGSPLESHRSTRAGRLKQAGLSLLHCCSYMRIPPYGNSCKTAQPIDGDSRYVNYLREIEALTSPILVWSHKRGSSVIFIFYQVQWTINPISNARLLRCFSPWLTDLHHGMQVMTIIPDADTFWKLKIARFCLASWLCIQIPIFRQFSTHSDNF